MVNIALVVTKIICMCGASLCESYNMITREVTNEWQSGAATLLKGRFAFITITNTLRCLTTALLFDFALVI